METAFLCAAAVVACGVAAGDLVGVTICVPESRRYRRDGLGRRRVGSWGGVASGVDSAVGAVMDRSGGAGCWARREKENMTNLVALSRN
jgi:hypothetical protein